MDISLEFTRRVLKRARSGRAADSLTESQIQRLGDLLLPTLRVVLLERDDEGLDWSAIFVLSRINTPSAVDLMLEVVCTGRPPSRSSAMRRTWLLWRWRSFQYRADEARLRAWEQLGEAPTREIEQVVEQLSHVRYVTSHPRLKDAVFGFRDSADDDECQIFCDLCSLLDWKDGLPFMEAMVGLVSPGVAEEIERRCWTLYTRTE